MPYPLGTVTLDASDRIAFFAQKNSVSVESATLTFVPSTGLFSGNYVDFLGKKRLFSGADISAEATEYGVIVETTTTSSLAFRERP